MMSKAKFMKKMAAVVMAGAMMTVMAVPVMAGTEPIGGGVSGLKISKTLEKYVNSYVPKTDFNFQIRPGTADVTNRVEAGPDGGVTFGGGKTTGSISFNHAAGDIGQAEKTLSTDLTVNQAVFTEPGIYRYEINEVTPTEGFEGIVYSGETVVLDIYKYSDGSFSYQFSDEEGNKPDAATFTNTYNHAEGQVQDLTVSKTVTGNFGNLSEEFVFHISVTSSDANELYYVTRTGGNPITEWDGTSTDIKLKSGESFTIHGLSATDSYTIEEADANKNGYTTTIENAESSEGGTASGTIDEDTTVEYTNARELTPPMGIVMDIAPYAIMVVAAFILGLGFLRIRHYGKK